MNSTMTAEAARPKSSTKTSAAPTESAIVRRVAARIAELKTELAALKTAITEREDAYDSTAGKLEKLRARIERLEEKDDPSEKDVEDLIRLRTECELRENGEEARLKKYHAAALDLNQQGAALAERIGAAAKPLTEATIEKYLALIKPLEADPYKARQIVLQSSACRNWHSILDPNCMSVALGGFTAIQRMERALFAISRALERGENCAF